MLAGSVLTNILMKSGKGVSSIFHDWVESYINCGWSRGETRVPTPKPPSINT